MDKEEFLKFNIEEQVQYINSRTITGLTVVQVAQEINMSESVIRRKLKKNNYVFNRVDKVYLSNVVIGNNEAILNENNIVLPMKKPKNIKPEVLKEIIKSNSNEIPQEEPKNNNNIIPKEEKKVLFSDKEVKELKELLAVKEQLLHIIITPRKNNGISIMEIDRSNRKNN